MGTALASYGVTAWLPTVITSAPEAREEALATIAPELPGALELIGELVGRGVRVAVGHTDADADTVRDAVRAGATSLTHLGNAMAPMLSRAPGPVGLALGGSALVAGPVTCWSSRAVRAGPGRWSTTIARSLPESLPGRCSDNGSRARSLR